MENCSFYTQNINLVPDIQNKIFLQSSLYTLLQISMTCHDNLEKYKDRVVVLTGLKHVYFELDQLTPDMLLVKLIDALTRADLKTHAYKAALIMHPLEKWFKPYKERNEHCSVCASYYLPIFAKLNQTKTLEFIEDTFNQVTLPHDALDLFMALLPFKRDIAYAWKDRLCRMIEWGPMRVQGAQHLSQLASSLMPYFPEDAKKILEPLKSDRFTGLNWLPIVIYTMVKCGETLQAQKIVDKAIAELPKPDPDDQAFHSIEILRALSGFNSKMFGEMVEETLSSFDSQEPTGMIAEGYALIGHLFAKTDPDRAFKLYEQSRESAFKIEDERCASQALAFMAMLTAKRSLPEAIKMIDSIKIEDIRLQAYVDLALDNIEV